MESIKSGVNAATEKVQEVTSGASKEANKEQAKNSNASIGDRVSAGASALGDKADESKHSASKEANKQSI